MSKGEPAHSEAACLQAAVLRLMTHYALHPTPEAAAAVVRVLDQLAQRHPHKADDPAMRKTLPRILADWRWVAAANRNADPLHGWRISSEILH